jgi:Lrp/AsnC family transcriptional regulator
MSLRRLHKVAAKAQADCTEASSCEINLRRFSEGVQMESAMLDIRDRRILEELQEDATVAVADLADTVGLSVSACWRRIKALEDAGFITRRVALIDRRKSNVPMTVFVAIRTSRHSMEWLDSFRKVIADIPEVVEAYRLTGDMDYLLRLVVPNVDVYDAVYKKMISRLDFTDITSSISMEELKFTTSIPLKYT